MHLDRPNNYDIGESDLAVSILNYGFKKSGFKGQSMKGHLGSNQPDILEARDRDVSSTLRLA